MAGEIHTHYPDDRIGLDGSVSDADRSKRLKEIQLWFDRFIILLTQAQQAVGHTGIDVSEISYADDAAERVNSLYWEVLVETVKRRITPCNGDHYVRADRYKICSLTELIIVMEQPILHANPLKQNHLNALLAFNCALTILGNWNKKVIKNLVPSPEFQKNHITWLEHIVPGAQQISIFSNAQTWQLIEMILVERHAISLQSP